jgi:hypothetical protein
VIEIMFRKIRDESSASILGFGNELVGIAGIPNPAPRRGANR